MGLGAGLGEFEQGIAMFLWILSNINSNDILSRIQSKAMTFVDGYIAVLEREAFHTFLSGPKTPKHLIRVPKNSSTSFPALAPIEWTIRPIPCNPCEILVEEEAKAIGCYDGEMVTLFLMGRDLTVVFCVTEIDGLDSRLLFCLGFHEEVMLSTAVILL
jgi:hypothetical protein